MPPDNSNPLTYADGVSPGILLADARGNCIHVNQRWLELTGATAAQSAGDGWIEFVHPDQRESLRRSWISCVRERREMSAELDWGARHTILTVSLLGVEVGAPSGFVLTLLEAAAAPGNDPEALHARKMETVGRLASGVAHDFANLLTLISGYGEIVRRQLEPHHPLRANVDEICEAADRGADLTRQLLDFGRRQSLEPRHVDLNALIRDLGRMLRPVIGEHIELATYLDPALGRIQIDPGQMEQAILNVALNARDAMPRGGRIVIRTANVDLGPDDARVKRGLAPGRYAMLRCTDNGCGMDQATLDHMFEAFFTTKAKGQGTGLGLATVQSIVKQNRGDVWAESAPGVGTTLTILLPRADGEPRPAFPDRAAKPAAAGHETILLVEDEESLRRLLRQILFRQGYNVLEAADGAEALAVFEKHRSSIQLLLTDIVMPRMNGRELADRLSEIEPSLKIVFMSGYTREVSVGAGKAHSGALFLEKPLIPDVLTARLREVMDRAAAP